LLLLVPAALSAAPRTFAIDGNASTAKAHVGKTGIGGFAGHEHNVIAGSLQGEVQFDPQNLEASAVDLIVVTRKLRVSEQGEPEGDAAKVEERMRGPEVLNVPRFPTIHFRSTRVYGQLLSPNTYELRIIGELSMHGMTKQLPVPVQLHVLPDGSLLAEGELAVQQTDFGIEPTTVAGGLVKVENEVTLTFHIAARPQGPEPPAATDGRPPR
jgi:polyisoprenoid-binding protein YceI